MRPLLIFDLDETLVSSSITPGKCDHVTPDRSIYMTIRPGVIDFLNRVSTHFDLAVWSRGSKEYVEWVASKLFDRWVFVWDGERCTRTMTMYNARIIKNLKKVWRLGYRREKTLIFDDLWENSVMNYGNWVPVPEYHGGDDSFFDTVHPEVILDEIDFRVVKDRITRLKH